jgi:hypothetical protein
MATKSFLMKFDGSKRKFDVRSFYNILASKEASPFPWKNIWRTKAPSRVAFFTKTAVLGKILTIDNLKKRNLIMINRCCLCKLDGETINHLLIHCVDCSLWYAIFSRFGLLCVMPSNVVGLLACCVENGSSMPRVVFVVRKECKMLQGF